MSETTKLEKFSAEWVLALTGGHELSSDRTVESSMVRLTAAHMIRKIIAFCPDCADRTAAIRHVREAMMAANASIALDGLV